MKLAFVFLAFILLIGCRTEGLDVTFRTSYSSLSEGESMNKMNAKREANMADYTEFGSYVGSITPGKVSAKFNSIRYIDKASSHDGMQTMVELISTNWADDDKRRFADFTNGNSVDMLPEMWGNIDNDGWFVGDTIRFRYLGIFPQNFEFEFELPLQYNNKQLNLNCPIPNYVTRVGNTVKCQIHFLLWPIKNEEFDNESGRRLNGFVFGETDSTYIVRQDKIPSADITELISMAQPHCVARSGNYVCPVLTPPKKGKSKIVTTTIRFNSQNIIQQYAGFDNMAYTADDIFVLKRNFWEGFNITINQN